MNSSNTALQSSRFIDHSPLAKQPIGIFDSGLGGLTVLKELRQALPGERFIYLGDTARTPYGSKSAATVLRYGRECKDFLLRREIKLLVVACNTVSAVALSQLEQEVPCPVVGTIEPAVRQALAASPRQVIGVIGTDATIESGVYQQRFQEIAPDAVVIAKSCPLFVPLVENGFVSGPIAEQVVEFYLSSFKQMPLDVLVLGCTHYPLLSSVIRSYLGPKVEIVECSKTLAREVSELLETKNMKHPLGESSLAVSDQSQEEYFVTDAVGRFNFLSGLFLNSQLVDAIHVEDL